MQNDNTSKKTEFKMKSLGKATNLTILDTIKELKKLGVTKVGFNGLDISYVEMTNDKTGPEVSPADLKKAMDELDEETLYFSAN
jgi:hypothetical protein